MAWFESWFNSKYYHILYDNRNFDEAEGFIRLLSQFLNLPKHARVIDLACGKGRHSVFINQLGYHTLGLDLAKESIQNNKQFESHSLKFEVHDMRDEIHCEPVDAVFNLFSSFGYFEDPKDDEKVFQSVFNVLNTNGFFVLDFLNAQHVKNTLVSEELILKQNIEFKIKRKIENNHVIKDIFFKDEGQDFHFFEKVKLHRFEDIETLAQFFKFERVKVFGNYDLQSFNLNESPRCIFVFKKTI